MAKKRTLRTLTREPLTESERKDAKQELLSGTDRSAALVGCALVETALLKALMTRFVKMDDQILENLFYSPTAPLATFSSRIQVGRAIGLFDVQLQNALDGIRRVRNAFAHSSRPLKFNNELIQKECATLPDAKLKEVFKKPPTTDPHRERYIATCVNLLIILEDHAKTNVDALPTIGIPDRSLPLQKAV
jgi:hypothetical protein